ncbi:MAG: AAA family ATPase [Clostridiales bacterium]|nr:AAA family ATPase [Clostridiales bacterium]
MTDDIRRLSTDDICKELDGVVTAVKLIYERNGFVIFACKGGFSVKGSFPGNLAVGISYHVEGRVTTYQNQLQISATLIEACDDGNTDKTYVAGFLKDTFKDIGEVLASRLAEIYGADVLAAIVKDPLEVIKEVEGLSIDKLSGISEKLEEEPDYYRTLLDLRLMGLTKGKADKVYSIFGKDSIACIKDNPYSLMKVGGIGFDTCEYIARRLNMELLSISRFEGAIVSAVASAHEETGDTYLEPSKVRQRTMALLAADTGGQIPDEVFDGLYQDALVRAKDNKYIVIYRFKDNKCVGCDADDEGARIAGKTYFGTEHAIKKEIENFLTAKKVVPDEEKTRKKIRLMGEKRGITLDPLQEDALFMCMYSPLAIITGGPGTGKTTITSILAEHFRSAKIDFAFCAPTGRAAKRLSEASGVDACTIHRLLEMSVPSEDEEDGYEEDALFGRNRANPLEQRVIVADEASMIDIFLFKALLDALKPGASLILVGDPEQLPSVGAGNLLSDLLSCEVISCVKLKYIFRQDEDSSIASNAVRILRGEYPVPGEDFEIIKTATDEEALPHVIRLSLENKDKDFSILSPTRRKELGTEYLNRILQKEHNEGSDEAVKAGADLELYPGDIVMQIRNNYSIEYFDPKANEISRGVFNGEIGRFLGYEVLTGKYDFEFDQDRRIGYDRKTISDIDLAYALTVHKAQGCEFDSVALALGAMNYRLSNRKLLYTAVTRGRNKVTIIDSGDRLSKMLRSEGEFTRKTSLPGFLSIVAGRHEDDSDKGRD